MPQIVKITLLIAFSYFLAAIPFGLIVAKKIKNIDVRNFGSGNIGATNVVRVVGFKWGALVFVLDFLKGFLPVLATFLVLDKGFNFLYTTTIIVALAAISGHNWPIYLKFRGGKGVSTSIGAVVGLSMYIAFLRIPVLLTICIWTIVFFLSRLVGLASLLGGFSFFLSCLLMPEVSREFKLLSFFVALFITIRHRQNIRDIWAMFRPKS